MNKIVLEQNDINIINDICNAAKENGNADNLRVENVVLNAFDVENAQRVQHGFQFDLNHADIENLKLVAKEANLQGENRDDYQKLITKINNKLYTSQVPGSNPGLR